MQHGEREEHFELPVPIQELFGQNSHRAPSQDRVDSFSGVGFSLSGEVSSSSYRLLGSDPSPAGLEF